MADDLLTVIIVDDEQPARAVLKGLLETHCPMLKTVAECANADEAFEKITNLKPGLVFLDIEMPRSSGFDLLRRFGKINFRVIFTTAFSEYALQAFRFSAVDYLLKPLKAEELVEAVAKFRLELEANQRLERIQVLLDNLRARDENSKRIVVADS